MDLPCYICCHFLPWSYFIFEQMKHILFDLEGCSSDLLDDARHVRNSLFHAAILSNSKILKIDAGPKRSPNASGPNGYPKPSITALSISKAFKLKYSKNNIKFIGEIPVKI